MVVEYQDCIQRHLGELGEKGLYMTIVNYLHTIVVSGYWKEEQWQSWADQLIMNHDELEDWVFDVAFAQSKEELCLAIAHKKITEVLSKETLYWEPDVVIGYYYLMFQEGRMGLSELFLRLIDEDDIASEAALFDMPEAMSMLNKAKVGEVDIKKLDELLMPLAKVAGEQLVAITHYYENV